MEPLGVLRGFFGDGFSQVEILFDLSSFVSVFLGFFGTTVDAAAEGMFAVTYGFAYHVQRFNHIFFLSSTELSA
jgi:hypothetical protein